MNYFNIELGKKLKLQVVIDGFPTRFWHSSWVDTIITIKGI